MSTRERCHMLLDELNDVMLNEIIAYIEELKLSDNADDMNFCVSLYDETKANDDGSRVSSKNLRAKYGV